MANKATREPLGATDSGPRPGGFPVGSVQSRAAARVMLVARKASENELRFQVVSVVTGERVSLDGLADQIKAARLRIGAIGEQAAPPACQSGQDFSVGRQEDCLAERIRRARERVERMRGRDGTS